MTSEETVKEQLLGLRTKLAKKQTFEEAVSSIAFLLRDRYTSASPSLRQLIYSTVCRVATLLQTRYTARGFWLAGLSLFEDAEKLVTEPSEKDNLHKFVARAREHLNDMENEAPSFERRQSDSRYLFEGHLTVEPEPAPPAWLVAQNLLTTLAVAQDWTATAESSQVQEENNNTTESSTVAGLPATVRELMSNLQEINGFLDLENVIEASLQEIGAGT
ncbi:E3 ubiquitin-protein ligase AIP2-like [Phalaenopsis equestris]|uniref:E3 ubiquitin-protein ligase AIP2-like n=1 Tax=Phalaenopsis equestris TaxID=78828 RepID=UPI0009E21EEC|nr:E3 ubiquitin-protein ligase AIP2-like [Phalaenopsis equestris]